MAPTIRIVALTAALYTSLSPAERILYSSDDFLLCGDNSQLTASSLNVSITPDNQTITYAINGTNKFSGNATIGIALFINSETNEVFKSTLDPCSSTEFPDFCPSSPGPYTVMSSMEIPQSSLNRIPDNIYTGPFTDATFEFIMNNTATNQTVGCLQAHLKHNKSQASGDDSNSTTSGSGLNGGNNTNGSNSTGGSGVDSVASASDLSWTLLLYVALTVIATSS